MPIIRKARYVYGKNLVFRNANKNDAGFILSLRSDPQKSRFLSAISSELADQEDWLAKYANLNDQAYFIIEYEAEPIGTVRLYDSRDDSFCWGSWILTDYRPSLAAIESALMVYAYAIDYLGFSGAHFDVRKGNERVWQFHERFGAKRIDETKFDYFYSIENSAIQMARLRYQKFLPEGVKVEFEME